MSVKKTLARNTIFNAAGRLWEAAVNIVLAAYIVPRIGLAAWGLWALVSVFTGYVALFDLGIGSGFAKYIAEHAARRDHTALSSIVSTGFFAYLLVGTILITLGWPCVDGCIALLHWFTPDRLTNTTMTADARFLLRWGLVLFATSNCIGAFAAVQTGLQRMDITNLISFGTSLVKITATIAFLETGHGVRGLLYAQAITLTFHAITCIPLAYLLVPGLNLSPHTITRNTFRHLFSYGWKTQISRLSNLIAFQTDKLIIGAIYKQMDLIGIYRIGEELATKMRQAPVLLLTALIPAASDLDARGEEDRLRRLYLLSSKYVAAVTLPLVAFTISSSSTLIRAWMGDIPHLETAAWINRIIAFGYLANILPGAGVSIALGRGRPEIQMKSGLIEMTANITLTITLVLTIGFYGVPLGTATAMIISCIWFIRAMNNIVPVSPRELIHVALYWPAIASTPGFLLCLAGEKFATTHTGRIPSLAIATTCAATFTLSYLLILNKSPFLDTFDREFFRGLLKKRKARHD